MSVQAHPISGIIGQLVSRLCNKGWLGLPCGLPLGRRTQAECYLQAYENQEHTPTRRAETGDHRPIAS